MKPRLTAAGMAVDWIMDDAFAALQPDEHLALQLLRIVQELLSNVIKHSHATRTLSRRPGEVFDDSSSPNEAAGPQGC